MTQGVIMQSSRPTPAMLRCIVCHGLLVNPVELQPCRHIVCRSCVLAGEVGTVGGAHHICPLCTDDAEEASMAALPAIIGKLFSAFEEEEDSDYDDASFGVLPDASTASELNGGNECDETAVYDPDMHAERLRPENDPVRKRQICCVDDESVDDRHILMGMGISVPLSHMDWTMHCSLPFVSTTSNAASIIVPPSVAPEHLDTVMGPSSNRTPTNPSRDAPTVGLTSVADVRKASKLKVEVEFVPKTTLRVQRTGDSVAPTMPPHRNLTDSSSSQQGTVITTIDGSVLSEETTDTDMNEGVGPANDKPSTAETSYLFPEYTDADRNAKGLKNFQKLLTWRHKNCPLLRKSKPTTVRGIRPWINTDTPKWIVEGIEERYAKLSGVKGAFLWPEYTDADRTEAGMRKLHDLLAMRDKNLGKFIRKCPLQTLVAVRPWVTRNVPEWVVNKLEKRYREFIIDGGKGAQLSKKYVNRQFLWPEYTDEDRAASPKGQEVHEFLLRLPERSNLVSIGKQVARYSLQTLADVRRWLRTDTPKVLINAIEKRYRKLMGGRRVSSHMHKREMFTGKCKSVITPSEVGAQLGGADSPIDKLRSRFVGEGQFDDDHNVFDSSVSTSNAENASSHSVGETSDCCTPLDSRNGRLAVPLSPSKSRLSADAAIWEPKVSGGEAAIGGTTHPLETRHSGMEGNDVTPKDTQFETFPDGSPFSFTPDGTPFGLPSDDMPLAFVDGLLVNVYAAMTIRKPVWSTLKRESVDFQRYIVQLYERSKVGVEGFLHPDDYRNRSFKNGAKYLAELCTLPTTEAVLLATKNWHDQRHKVRARRARAWMTRCTPKHVVEALELLYSDRTKCC